MRLRSRPEMSLLCAPLLLAAVCTFSASALADEAYVCEGGRIVYVAFGDLERLKRTDACIAAHYGLAVAPTAPVAAAPSSGGTQAQSQKSRAKAKVGAPVPIATAPIATAPEAAGPIATAPAATARNAPAPIATAPVATAPVATAPAAAATDGPAQRASRSARPGRAGQPAVNGAVSLPVRTIAVRRVVEEGKPPREVTAAPSTDYRNVRILNATPAEQQWYRHDM